MYYIAIPGCMGGYSYFFEEQNGKLVMHANLTSRMQWREEYYEYYKITIDGIEELQGKKRKGTAEKFFVLGMEQLGDKRNTE